MIKRILHLLAQQEWLKAWNPQSKHDLLCLRIAETIDGALVNKMNIDKAWLIVNRSSIALSLSPNNTGSNKALAKLKLFDFPSFITAYRLLEKEVDLKNTTAVTDAVETAFDEIADEILRLIYGKRFLAKLHNNRDKNQSTFKWKYFIADIIQAVSCSVFVVLFIYLLATSDSWAPYTEPNSLPRAIEVLLSYIGGMVAFVCLLMIPAFTHDALIEYRAILGHNTKPKDQLFLRKFRRFIFHTCWISWILGGWLNEIIFSWIGGGTLLLWLFLLHVDHD